MTSYKPVRNKIMKLSINNKKIIKKEKSLNNMIAKHNRLAKELNRTNERISRLVEEIETLKSSNTKEMEGE